VTDKTVIEWKDGSGRKGRAWPAGIVKMLKSGRRITAQRADRVARASVRERVLKVARGEVGTTEQPAGSNRGPRVEKYQGVTTVPGSGWPYCMAGVVWCCIVAGIGAPLGYRGAYVPDFERVARARGRFRATMPKAWEKRLVAILFDFNGDGVADHVGFVERGSLETIEFNTSPGATGSQANGGGVYRRDRSSSVVRGYVLIA
jgi:hypothetical protein